MWAVEVALSRDAVSFDVVNLSISADEIKREAEATIKNLRTQHDYLAEQVAAFNQHIGAKIQKIVSARRNELLKRLNLLASLGVPIRNTSAVPASLAVPVVHKKLAS